jgi:hypothetical protein
MSVINTFNKVKLFIIKYKITLFLVISCSLIGLIIIDITIQADANPTQSQIDEAKKSVKVITFKKESINVINNLREQNITIDTLFDPGRVDPFND